MCPFLAYFLSVFVLCQSVSASILLPQRYFVPARMSALPLFKRKTGVSHSRFCPFLHLLHLLCGEDKPISPRVYIICRNMPKLTFALFAPFAHIFHFSWARQKNVSFRFSYHSTFLCRCQHLYRIYTEKLSTGGLADPPPPARCTRFSALPFLYLTARGKVLMSD